MAGLLFCEDLFHGQGANQLAAALKGNYTLRSLNLERNWINVSSVSELANALKINRGLIDLKLALNSIDDNFLKKEMDPELIKNSQLHKVDDGAKGALGIIKDRLNSSDTLGDTFYPQEIMDQVVDQMILTGLKQEVIDLSHEITPPEKPPKS